jgi:hypothetical protein
MRSSERGTALPLVLFALVVIAALAGGGFAAALLEQRIGRNALFAMQAEGAAEAGVGAVLAGWDDHSLSLLSPGDSVTLPGVPLPGGGRYTPAVMRLNRELFLLRVEGARHDAEGGMLARRRLGLLVRLSDSVVPGLPPAWPVPGRAWAYPPH